LKLLLIDEGDSGDWLANRLAGIGFIPDVVESAQQAISDRKAENVSAVVADAGFQSQCADTLVRPLRRAGIEQPLLVLSSMQDWHEMIDCLDAGADDYVVKPARSDVIAARLRAIIRRRAGRSADRIAFDDIEIDIGAKCAWMRGRCLDLTRNEFRLLRLLLLESNRVLSHEEIRGQLYSDAQECTQNAVEVLIARLRRKIGRERIGTIRGVGYRFKPRTVPAKAPHEEREACSADSKNSAGMSDKARGASQANGQDVSMASWTFAI